MEGTTGTETPDPPSLLPAPAELVHWADDATGLLGLANDGHPIRSDASRPIEAVGASDRVARLAESEDAGHDDTGE
jgi:hypothetical protein